MEKNYFNDLAKINVNDHAEKKNGLTYLSWAWAWAEIKKLHPDAVYTIYENADGWLYHTDGRTCWVKTGVTVNGIEHIEYLPVMDHRNRSIPLDQIDSFAVNKAVQRSLTKACARHGLGLYIYAGEDLPEDEQTQEPQKKAEPMQEKPKLMTYLCASCGTKIEAVKNSRGKVQSVDEQIKYSRKTFGMDLCLACAKREYMAMLEAKEKEEGKHDAE